MVQETLEQALTCHMCGEIKTLVRLEDGDGLIIHSCLGSGGKNDDNEEGDKHGH